MQLHHLGRALSNLWDLMDASYEGRQKFFHVIDLLSSAPSDVCAPMMAGGNRLFFVQIFPKAEAEVKRLDQLVDSGLTNCNFLQLLRVFVIHVKLIAEFCPLF